MDEKKHIDRLFQEKLKDFEVFPDAEVWKNIEEQLVKKKKRRVVPLWLRLGGAAAILLLLVSGGIWMYNSQRTIPKLPDTNSIITDVNSEDKNENLDENNVLNPERKQQDAAKRDEELVIVPQEQDHTLKNTPKRTYIVATPKNIEKKKILDTSNEDNSLANEHSLAQLNQEEDKKSTKEIQDIKVLDKTQETVIALNSKTDQTQESQDKKDITEAIKENETEVALLEKDDDAKKWSVGSTVAPVYFNTLSKGSPIHSALASNEKNSRPSLSYGVKVNYKINKRLSLQSGVNSLDLSYQTEGVTALVTSTNSLTNDTNINTNVNGLKVITLAAPSSSANADLQSQELAANGERTFNNLSGDLNQSLSYIEIPMEAKYALVQKKVGVNLIGGVSTYVLYRNTVDIENTDGSITLGEASNLNDVNFSGNVGLDLDYKINKKLYINVTPMFKYQLNTFSKNDGGFRPYYLGVYTGLNFRF